ncbi:hypothetical protein SMICM304S_10679 [Streptomyces microflavus]
MVGSGETEGLMMPHLTPSRSCSSRPVTKVGMAMTTRVRMRTVVSMGRPRRRPVTTPRLMPMTISKTIATMVSRMVMGKAVAISSVTFCPLNAVPKSPVNRFPM